MEIQSDGPPPSKYELQRARAGFEKEKTDSGDTLGIILFFAIGAAILGLYTVAVKFIFDTAWHTAGSVLAYTILGVFSLGIICGAIYAIVGQIRKYLKAKREIDRLKELEKDVV